MKIRNMYTQEVIYEDDATTIKATVENAIKNGVDLSSANHQKVDLRGANLSGANLYSANLQDANLQKVDLSGANLSGANLYSANLQDANLRYANLQDANLSSANLQDANLSGANLYSANLQDVAYNYGSTGLCLSCPETGSFTAYKKVRTETGTAVVTLRIPARAKRSSATTRKCRAEYVKVLSGEGYTDFYGPRTEYRKGAIVRADKWDDDRWNGCSNGIHFFMTRYEADEWEV